MNCFIFYIFYSQSSCCAFEVPSSSEVIAALLFSKTGEFLIKLPKLLPEPGALGAALGDNFGEDVSTLRNWDGSLSSSTY
jgi:hypothetical protein